MQQYSSECFHKYFHSVHWVSLRFFPAKSHLKSANSQSPPLLGNLPPLYWFFVNPPLKVVFFSEPPKSFSSLALSYLLKVTKFLVKISWFEFLVMTEKNIFSPINFFFAIKYFTFYFFCVKILTPVKKVTPSFPATPPVKAEVLSRPPFF